MMILVLLMLQFLLLLVRLGKGRKLPLPAVPAVVLAANERTGWQLHAIAPTPYEREMCSRHVLWGRPA